MVALARRPVRMSVRDFLAWETDDGVRYELVDGEPRARAPASTMHGYLQSELGGLIRNHRRARGSPCEVIANPGVVPHLLAAHNVRAPDLGVTCAPLAAGQATLPDPVLLIEILSPSNAARAWSNVWTYTSIPAVREILVLHSSRVMAELLRRDADGGWPTEPERVQAGDLALIGIDFRVAMAVLFARTGLPP